MSPDELQVHKIEAYLSGMMAGLWYAKDLVEEYHKDHENAPIVTEQDLRDSFATDEPDGAHCFSDEEKKTLINKYIEGWQTGARAIWVE